MRREVWKSSKKENLNLEKGVLGNNPVHDHHGMMDRSSASWSSLGIKMEILKRNNSRIDSNKIQNWPIYPTIIFSQSTSGPCDPWQSFRWRPIREPRKGWKTVNYGLTICCRSQLNSKEFYQIHIERFNHFYFWREQW